MLCLLSCDFVCIHYLETDTLYGSTPYEYFGATLYGSTSIDPKILTQEAPSEFSVKNLC